MRMTMRASRRLARERLLRLRERAQAARAVLGEARRERPWARPAAPIPEQPAWSDAPPGRRADRRSAGAGEASVRRLGGFRFELRLENVSAGGCKVELVEPVACGDHVIARLPGLEPLGARVRWADTRAAGLHFDRPLHPAVFELLLTRLG